MRSRGAATSAIRRGILVVALCGLVLAAAGCGKSASPTAGDTATTQPATSTGVPSGVAPPTPSAGIAAKVPPTPAELVQGRRVFQAVARPAGCSFCHTLEAAANTSPIGPSLDAEVSEADLRSLDDKELAQRVRNWIHKPQCFGPTDAARCMPSDLYTGEQADLVSVFVAVCGRTPDTPGCEPVAGGLHGQARAGEQLFQSRGCVGCHFTIGPPSTGPLLSGVAGSRVQLDNGKTVTADDEYLVESIASPDRKIVQGYQAGLMSSRVTPQHLSNEQILALVAYIKTLK